MRGEVVVSTEKHEFEVGKEVEIKEGHLQDLLELLKILMKKMKSLL